MDCFSQDYRGARDRFTVAARAADAGVVDNALDRRGPDGGELSNDVAWLGRADLF
jgi:hypothetical protein